MKLLQKIEQLEKLMEQINTDDPVYPACQIKLDSLIFEFLDLRK